MLINISKNGESSSHLPRLLKKIDIFYKPIGLTYEKERFFKTSLGGAITLVLGLIIISIFLYKLDTLIHYGESQSKMNLFVADLKADTGHMYFEESKLALMVSIGNLYRDRFFVDKKWGSFKFFRIIRVEDKDPNDPLGKIYNYTMTEVPAVICNESNPIVKNLDKSKYATYNLETFFCPDAPDLLLSGRQQSGYQERIFVSYDYCIGEDYCANETEMAGFLQEATAFVLFADQWFDQENYTEPLQGYVQEQVFILDPSQIIAITTFVQNNTLDLYDSYLGFSHVQKSFPKVSENFDIKYGKHEMFRMKKNQLFRLFMFIGSDYVAYERRIYNANNLLKDVGGLFTSIFFVSKVVFSFFSLSLYYSSMIEKAYWKEDDSGPVLRPGKQTKREYEGEIQAYLESLNAFKFSPFQILKMALSRFTFCCTRNGSGRKKSLTNYFWRGQDRLIQELDCIEVINKLRIVDLLYTLNFNKIQRVASKYSRQRVISLNDTCKEVDTNPFQDHKSILEYVSNLREAGISSASEMDKLLLWQLNENPLPGKDKTRNQSLDVSHVVPKKSQRKSNLKGHGPKNGKIQEIKQKKKKKQDRTNQFRGDDSSEDQMEVSRAKHNKNLLGQHDDSRVFSHENSS